MQDAQEDGAPVEIQRPPAAAPQQQGGEKLSEVLQSVDAHSDGVVKVIQAFGEEVRKTKESHSKDLRHLARWFFGSLAVLVAISGALVFADKMSGASFTFLVGTLVGSIITFVGMMGFTSRQA